jgi:hypothetical protein
LMDKIKGIYTIPPQDAKIQIILIGLHELLWIGMHVLFWTEYPGSVWHHFVGHRNVLAIRDLRKQCSCFSFIVFTLLNKQNIFRVTSVSKPALRPTQPPIQWGSFFGGKVWPGHEADHSPSSSAKAINY